MTATERLRALLDERGVEWFGSYDSLETSWNVGELTWVYGEDENHLIAGLGVVQGDITPEQAVEATLGRGECHVSKPNCSDFDLRCSACGEQWSQCYEPHYCPNCGRKVVDG